MTMETLRLSLLFVHLLGTSVILGGFLTHVGRRATAVPDAVVGAMFHGAIVQLITGVALVNVRIAQDLDDSHAKFATKAAIAVAVLVAAWLRRRPKHQQAFFYATGLLTALNVAVAVFWT
jgi:HD-like signal output (HDOD) protein